MSQCEWCYADVDPDDVLGCYLCDIQLCSECIEGAMCRRCASDQDIWNVWLEEDGEEKAYEQRYDPERKLSPRDVIGYFVAGKIFKGNGYFVDEKTVCARSPSGELFKADVSTTEKPDKFALNIRMIES